MTRSHPVVSQNHPVAHFDHRVIYRIMHLFSMIIVHACTMIIVYACTMVIVHACTTIIVHACTTVHYCQSTFGMSSRTRARRNSGRGLGWRSPLGKQGVCRVARPLQCWTFAITFTDFPPFSTSLSAVPPVQKSVVLRSPRINNLACSLAGWDMIQIFVSHIR